MPTARDFLNKLSGLFSRPKVPKTVIKNVGDALSPEEPSREEAPASTTPANPTMAPLTGEYDVTVTVDKEPAIKCSFNPHKPVQSRVSFTLHAVLGDTYPLPSMHPGFAEPLTFGPFSSDRPAVRLNIDIPEPVVESWWNASRSADGANFTLDFALYGPVQTQGRITGVRTTD